MYIVVRAPSSTQKEKWGEGKKRRPLAPITAIDLNWASEVKAALSGCGVLQQAEANVVINKCTIRREYCIRGDLYRLY